MKINVREYRRGNQQLTIQRNWQHRVHKTKKNKTVTQYNTMCGGHHLMCVGHHYTQTETNNVNNTLALLQTTIGKDEPNIVLCGNRYEHHSVDLRT
jgi:hypothetical protein